MTSSGPQVRQEFIRNLCFDRQETGAVILIGRFVHSTSQYPCKNLKDGLSQIHIFEKLQINCQAEDMTQNAEGNSVGNEGFGKLTAPE